MHDPLSQTGQWLKSIVRGHFNYYAVPGNTASLSRFRHRTLVLWWHSVRRRSQKRRISWARMLDLVTRWLPCTASAPSLSRCPFRRYSSEIRTGCANERPSGSVEGVVSNHDPYSDHQNQPSSDFRLRRPSVGNLRKHLSPKNAQRLSEAA